MKTTSWARVGAVLAVCAVTAGTAHAAAFNAWSPAAAMSTARFGQTATLLPGGNVLVAGGQTNPLSALPLADTSPTAEVYSPSTDTWSPAAAMGTARMAASAVRLGNGDVLVVGGNDGGAALETGEVYDPAADTWTPVANTMSSPRDGRPSAVLLRDGQVLIAGGADSAGAPVASADVYDPATNRFTPVASMRDARADAVASPLVSGKVLVAGGLGTSGERSDGEVYDPSSGQWSTVSNTMTSAREDAGAAGLANGDVLIAGGTSHGTATASADVYDPVAGVFFPGPAMSAPRALSGIAPLPDGRVVVAGGQTATAGGSSAMLQRTSEVFDPARAGWTPAGDLPGPAAALTLIGLPNGQVLGDGGVTSLTGATATGVAELFTPAGAPGAPTGVTATAGNGVAVVTFAPPVSDGGLAIEHYTVTASTGQGVTTADARTAATVTGLKNGRGVNFMVAATNALGTGPASALSPAVTPLGPPGVTLVRVPHRLRLKAFLKGLKFVVVPDEPASWEITLLGGLRRATIARSFNLTLARKRLGLGVGRRTVSLKPRRALVGRPRRATVELVIVATTRTGVSSTMTRKIRLTG